jgi:cytochrome c biogenesis factor
MAARTSSNNTREKPRNRAAYFSLAIGVLAVLAIPVAVYVTDQRNDLRLLHAGVAVPVAALLGIVAIRLAKRARRRLERTLERARGARSARFGRILGWLGLYLALIGAIALGSYYVEYHVLS